MQLRPRLWQHLSWAFLCIVVCCHTLLCLELHNAFIKRDLIQDALVSWQSETVSKHECQKNATVYSIYMYILLFFLLAQSTMLYLILTKFMTFMTTSIRTTDSAYRVCTLATFPNMCCFFLFRPPTNRGFIPLSLRYIIPLLIFGCPNLDSSAKVPPARHDELVVNGLPLSGVGVIIDLRLRSRAAPLCVFFCGSDSS